MKKKISIIALCVAVAGVIAYFPIKTALGGNDVMSQWGKILSDDSKNETSGSKGKFRIATDGPAAQTYSASDEIFECGKDILITKREIEVSKAFYMLKGESEKTAEKEAVKYMEELYAGYSTLGKWLEEDSSVYDALNSALGGSLTSKSKFSNTGYGFSGAPVEQAKSYYYAALSAALEYVNNATDELIELSNEAIGGGLTDKQKAEIMAMGELTSSRLFAAAIESLGVKAEFIDPYNDKWPVITDSNSLNAKIDFATTDKKCEGIKNLISQGIIPVICGFLGKGPSGEITTIGRGGSDVTAFLLGHCLSANNVVIVTDVDGVMSTDPNKIEEAELLDEISVEEMRDLATHGAQVLHPHALKYKDPLISAKIINFNNGDLSSEGTKITGPFEGDMLKTVSLYKNPISVIAIVGEEMLKKVGLLADLTSCLAENEINIFGISAGQNSITVFVEKKDSDKAYHLLHSWVIDEDVLSSLSLGDDTAMITVVSPEFIDEPGIISNITNPLRKNDINIVEISSSQTAVVLFVDWKDGEKALELIKEVLK